VQLIWPWQDRNHRFSWLKASTFALMFAPAIWLLDQIITEQFGPVPLGGMTYWSGLWATALLMLTLAITPAVTIFGWRQLIIVRRMIGVTALAYTIAHLIIYFALRFWNFASIAHEMVTRISLILATIATIGLIALGATSLDAAVRRMGAKGWQRLHNAVYAIAALALIHYLLSPDIYPEQYLMSGLFFWLMGWRLLNQRGQGTNPVALALLAVAACLFTAVLEFSWIWAYQDYQPSEILDLYFTLTLGIPPMWKILVLGLLIALAPAATSAPRLRPPALSRAKSYSQRCAAMARHSPAAARPATCLQRSGVAVKRVHRNLERAVFLAAPHNDGLAVINHRLSTWRSDCQRVAPDFNGEVTGLNDIDDFETKCLYPAINHALLRGLNGRPALDHRRSGNEQTGVLLVKRSQSGEILVRNGLCERRGEGLDLGANAHSYFPFD
jgi:methionine sulfoxide reductase heme-binding subunit